VRLGEIGHRHCLRIQDSEQSSGSQWPKFWQELSKFGVTQGDSSVGPKNSVPAHFNHCEYYRGQPDSQFVGQNYTDAADTAMQRRPMGPKIISLFLSLKISQSNIRVEVRCNEKVSVHVVDAKWRVCSALLGRGRLKERVGPRCLMRGGEILKLRLWLQLSFRRRTTQNTFNGHFQAITNNALEVIFYHEMRYINLRFTLLFFTLLTIPWQCLCADIMTHPESESLREFTRLNGTSYGKSVWRSE